MSNSNLSDDSASQRKNHWFVTTNWSDVLSAQGGDSPQAQQALEGLCRAYWYPLYAFLRRDGHSAEDAEDLTQGFFTHLLTTNALATVDRQKGRFRSFLLVCIKNYAES